MAVLYGTTETGETIPIQANSSGQLVAMGLQGVQGPPGQQGQQGEQGPPGPEGNIYDQLPPDPWEGAFLGWQAGELAWLGEEPIILPPQTVGPITEVDQLNQILTCEGDTNFQNLIANLDVVMTDKNGETLSFNPSTGPITEKDTEDDRWLLAVAAEANTWQSVTYGNGKFVAVSNDGTNQVMWSTDGIQWNSASAAKPYSWYSVTYGAGKFVAVAYSGENRVMWSTDGINWNAANAAEANNWYSVTYGNGKFVAVSYAGTNQVMWSTDAINWNAASAAEPNTWFSVTYGDGKFVAVSRSGGNQVMWSTDAINWYTASAAEANSWFSVTYGDGKFVAVSNDGTNRVMRSTDAVNWYSSFAAEANSWFSVTYGDDKFVAVSNDGTNQVMWSTDAVNWYSVSAGAANNWQSVTYGNDKFVAVSTGGTNRVMYSATGTGENVLKLTASTGSDSSNLEFLLVGDQVSQQSYNSYGEVSSIDTDTITLKNYGGTWAKGAPIIGPDKSGTGRLLTTPSLTAPKLFLTRSNFQWISGDVYVTQPETKVARWVVLDHNRLLRSVNRDWSTGTPSS